MIKFNQKFLFVIITALLLIGTTESNAINSSNTLEEVLYIGTLQMMDTNHWGRGTISILINSTGDYLLHFLDNVSINNGPDLYIYLSKTPAFSSIYDNPGDFIDLGSLYQQTGPFNVSIPKSTNLTLYKSIVIYCLPFSVVFSYATLTVPIEKDMLFTNTTMPKISNSISSSNELNKSDMNINKSTNSVSIESFLFINLLLLPLFSILKLKRKYF
jgi:hypothetical protein